MESPSGGRTASVSVLVVDDNALIRNGIVRTLRSIGVAVGTSSAEGALVLALASETRFDTVLTDFDLGDGEDGGRLLERIREILPRVRRVLMSGRHDLAFRVDPPWQCFLPKPMTADEVRAAVRVEAADRDRMGSVSVAPK